MGVKDMVTKATGKIIDYGKILLNDYERRDLLRNLEKDHQEWRDNQYAARQRWDLTESYINGAQIRDKQGRLHNHFWAEAESATRDFDDEFLVVNDILNIHLSNQQRLSSYEIRPEVIPNNLNDDKDKQGARIGRIFLADHIRRTGSEKIRKKIARILSVYGTCFSKTIFDPTKGRLIPRPTQDKTGMWAYSKDAYVPEGEIVWEYKSPRNILLPKWSAEMEHIDALEDVHIETIDWVYREYGLVVEAEAIRSDDIRILSTSSIIQNKSEVQNEFYTSTNLVLVKERYIKPSPKYPKGAIFVWTSKKLLRSSELIPFYPDGIPYDKCDFIYDDRDVMGDTPLWHEIPLQNMTNITMTAGMRYIKASAILRQYFSEKANLVEKDLTNGTARSVKIGEMAEMPKYEQVPPLQETFFKFNEIVQTYMQRLGAANDVARRQQALSGQAVSAMQEIDDTKLKPAMESIESMLRAQACKSLKLARRFITNNRIIKMTGRQGWTIDNFRGELLNENYDCDVKLMTGLPTNKMYRLELLTKLQVAGTIDRDEVREHLEFGSDEQLMEQIQKDSEAADMIIEKILDEDNYIPAQPDPQTGQPPMNPDGSQKMISKVIPHPWDNHQIIVNKLILAMRESFDEWSPNVQAAAEYTLSWHQQQIAAATMPPPPGGGIHPDAIGQPAPPPMPGGPGGPPPMPAAPPNINLQGKIAPPGSSIPMAEAQQRGMAQPPNQSAPQVSGGQNIPHP